MSNAKTNKNRLSLKFASGQNSDQNAAQVAKEGYLSLFTQNTWLSPNWRQHWFQLIGVNLYAYKDRDDRDLIVVIPLVDADVTDTSTAESSSNRQNIHRMTIRTKQMEEFYLSAYTLQSLYDWIDAIRRAQNAKSAATKPARHVVSMNLGASPIGQDGGLSPAASLASSSSSVVREGRMMLQDVLSDATSCKMFLSFLESEFSAENLAFLIKIDEFRLKKVHSELTAEVDRIIKDFVMEGAPLQVNLPATTAEDVCKQLNRDMCSPTMFDQAYKDIYKLVEKDSFSRFGSSPEGQMVELKWKSGSGWLLAGFLEKKSRSVMKNEWLRYIPKREWKNRYCALGVHSLLFSKGEEDVNSIGSGSQYGELVMDEVNAIKDLGGQVVTGGRPHQFDIELKDGTTRTFAAPDMETKMKWIQSLHLVLRVHQNKDLIKPDKKKNMTSLAIAAAAVSEEKTNTSENEIYTVQDDLTEDWEQCRQRFGNLYNHFALTRMQVQMDVLGHAKENRDVLRECSKEEKVDEVVYQSVIVNFSVATSECMVRLMQQVKKEVVEREQYSDAEEIKQMASGITELASVIVENREELTERWENLRKYLTLDKWTQLNTIITTNSESKTALLAVSEALLREMSTACEALNQHKATYLELLDTNSATFGRCHVCRKMLAHRGIPKVVATPFQPMKATQTSFAHIDCLTCAFCKQPAVSRTEWVCFFYGKKAMCPICHRRLEDADVNFLQQSREIIKPQRSNKAGGSKGVSKGRDSNSSRGSSSLPGTGTSLAVVTMTGNMANIRTDDDDEDDDEEDDDDDEDEDVDEIEDEDELDDPQSVTSDVHELDVKIALPVAVRKESAGGDEGKNSIDGDIVDDDDGVDDEEEDELDEDVNDDAPQGLDEEMDPEDAFGRVIQDCYDDEDDDDDYEDKVECCYCHEDVPAVDCISAMGMTWCQDHFRCANCDIQIDAGGDFIPRDNHPYCVDCFIDLYQPKCGGCRMPIKPGEDTFNVMSSSWHCKCFSCEYCGKCFGIGDEFVADLTKALCPGCFDKKYASKCAKCSNPIVGTEDYPRLAGQGWHTDCFKCDECMKSLIGETVYMGRPGELLCEEHYNARANIKCAKCGLRIEGKAKQIKSLYLHPDCVRCFVCNMELTGQKMFIQGNKLLCEDDMKQNAINKCVKCKEPIVGNDGLQVAGFKRHKTCMNCVSCGLNLLDDLELLVPKGEDVFCISCFDRLNGDSSNPPISVKPTTTAASMPAKPPSSQAKVSNAKPPPPAKKRVTLNIDESDVFTLPSAEFQAQLAAAKREL